MAPGQARISIHHHDHQDNKHLQRRATQTSSKPTIAPETTAKRTPKASIIQTNFLLIGLILCIYLAGIDCETKEFDWGDLGVSLANNKSPYNGAGSNLRILVSPQRRVAKNSYEYDYATNNSQPLSSQGETSYVIPGSSSSYVSQPSSLASHSAAYSALSASLATLKNRLNARGVNLSSSFGDTASQTGSLYQSAPASAYGYDLQSQSVSGQGQAGQAQAQPTYLSVTSNQQVDQQAPGGYASHTQGQGTDNKTIVLAIPAKINFLTGAKHQQQQQQMQQSQQQQQQQQTQSQQGQQLSVMQTSGEHQARGQDSYTTSKQLGLMSGQDNGVSDPASHMVGRDTIGGSVGSPGDQEQQQQQPHQHHQYVLVNSSPGATSGEQNAQLVSGTGLQAPPATYTNIYQAPTASVQGGSSGAYAVKYIPTYQTTLPQPTVPRLYSTSESGIGYSEAQIDDGLYGRYGGCLDTCNSADIRWRKYSVSKYKYCCSRSSQYDPQFEQPSSEKLIENSKQADDAFYNYMYRRTRSRRSRRPGSRRFHYKQSTLSSGSSNSNEDGPMGDSMTSEMAGGRGRYQAGSANESPYMRYHKSRQASHGSSDLHDSTSTGQTSGNKYMSKERSYRRGRSRDFDTIDSAHQSYDSSQDDENSYQSEQGARGSSSYGGGDESVGAGGGSRYGSDGQSSDEDDGRSTSSAYDEPSPSDLDADKNGSGFTEASDYSDEMSAEKPVSEETELETNSPPVSTYKYNANRRKKHTNKGSRLRKNSYGKYRKVRKNRLNKQTLEHSSSGQVNGTEYDSSSSSGDQHHQELSNSNNNNSSNDDEKQHNKDSTDNQEADKEAMNFSNKLKSMGLNDSAVVNLSKTTMHLKEILSILEKKAHLKSNESTPSNGQTTPSPLTTTSSTTSFYPLSLLGSQYANGASLQLPSDYLSTELSLKSPYRYEPPSLSSGLSMAPQPYPSINMDSYSSLAPYGSNQFAGLSSKQLNYAAAAAAAAAAAGHHPRKRRTNKHIRYNQLMMSKPHGLGSTSSLLQHSAFSKNPLLSSGYYSSLQYPYPYTRANYQSAFIPYPYKHLNKTPYQSPLSNPAALKMTANTGLYSDESRLHGMSNLDPLSNVASSLRPSTTMRLRSKPFMFQSNVLPLYSRHTILSQPIEK